MKIRVLGAHNIESDKTGFASFLIGKFKFGMTVADR